MKLLFADSTLQRTVESTVSCDARFGAQEAALVRQRICELLAADNLAIAATVPTLDVRRFDSRASGFTVNVSSRLQLRLEAPDPISHVGGAGEIDLAKVSTVRILAIEEM